MALTTPTSEKRPGPWAVRFMAHAMLGLLAWASLLWTVGPVHAIWIVSLIDLVLWEIGVQRVGAGWGDALLDTWATVLGGLVGFTILNAFTWGPLPYIAVFIAGAVSLGLGVWVRR